MRRKGRLLPLLVGLLIWGHLDPAVLGDSSSLNKDKSAPSGVIIDEAGARKSVSSSDKTRGREPPGSPVDLFMPDEFQFYTLNNDGQLVMKQMSKQEIQGMIAAGNGNVLPVDTGHHSQLSDGVPKVSEVVQNVQKVLKGELNKPMTTHTSSSSIPGNINSQWTNMLPYILSGGSLDQQDVDQDTSILLPTLDSDQSYVDIIPLQNSKPTEDQYNSGMNYVPVQSTINEEDIKLVQPLKPTTTATEKPIYLLGNMALDSGILGEHEVYTLPTKKPNRPLTTLLHHRLTTKRPSLFTELKDTISNMKNSSDDKPTLYIPLSVSPSLLADSQNPNNYDLSNEAHMQTRPHYVSNASEQKKNTTYSSDSEDKLITTNIPIRKTTVYAYPDESEFTRIPMIQVPVISAEKIITSTQRTNQQQTPTFEILPTISPGSITSTTVKDDSHPSKINAELMGGFKKPGITQKPSTLFHPIYEPINKLSTSRPTSIHSYRPVYEPTIKSSTSSSTYRPIYEPMTKPSTKKAASSTYHPIYKPLSTFHPVFDVESKLTTETTKPSSSYRPIYEASTSPSEEYKVTQYSDSAHTTRQDSTTVLQDVTQSDLHSEGLKVTLYPDNIYTTRKASSPVLEITTTPSTQSDLKVTNYPENTYHAEKGSVPPVIEGVTEPSIKSEGLEVIEYTTSVQESTIINENKDLLVQVIQQTPNYEKLAEVSATSENIQNKDVIFETTEQNEININIDTTTYINDISQNVDKYKLPEKTANSDLNENSYSTKDGNIHYTDKPIISEGSETTISNQYITEKATKPQADIITLSSQDESSITTGQSEESSTSKDLTKESESIFNQTDKIPLEFLETIIPNEISTMKSANIDESKEQHESTSQSNINKFVITEESSTTEKQEYETYTTYTVTSEQTQPISQSETATPFIPIDQDTTEYYTVKYDNSKTEIIEKESSNNEEPITTTNYSTSINVVDSNASLKENDKSTNEALENSILNNDEIETKQPIYEYSTSDYKYTDSDTEIGKTESSSLEVANSIKDDGEPSQTISEKENTKSSQSYTIEATNKPQTTREVENVNKIEEYASSTTKIYITESDYSNTLKDDIISPVYEKIETITEKDSSEENASTVRVIPIYDDDDKSIYNLDKVTAAVSTSPAITSYNNKSEDSENSKKDSHKEPKLPITSHKTTQSTKLSSQQEYMPLGDTTSETPSYTTPSNSIRDTVLPGLYETLNNYIKEHYDPNLSSTNNYDEISHSTIFPTTINEDFSNNKNKLSTLPLTMDTTTEIPKYQINEQEEQLNTNINTTFESTESLNNVYSSTSQNDALKITSSLEQNSENKHKTVTMKHPEVNKNKIETPIIYLDLASPNSNKQSIPHQINKDHMSNSSLTRIKIKNPVMDIDKIISEAQAQTNTPSTITYTLPSNIKDPSNIASGLIAGYPIHSQNKPVTESIPDTTLHSIIYGTKKPSVSKESEQLRPQESKDNVTEKYNIDQEEKSTTLLSSNNEKDVHRVSSTASYTQVEESSVHDDQTSKIPNYESFTQIPFESLPITNKPKIPSQTEENYDQISTSLTPPLEKINDLINQLQNSPPELDSIKYEFSNGIMTTIVPLNNQDAAVNEIAKSTTKADTFTTKLNKLNKTSTESHLRNSTYVMLQTLPTRHTSKPYQSSTKPIVHSTTTMKSNVVQTTTPANSKAEPTSGVTTLLSTAKYTVTKKPYVTSTHSTTKGSLDKIQSTIDKSAGRINLEEEKNKVQHPIKPTESTKFTMKNKNHYSTIRRPGGDGHLGYTRKTPKPLNKSTTMSSTPYTTSKPIEEKKDTIADKWTLIPQKNDTNDTTEIKNTKEEMEKLNPQIITLDHSTGAIGLDQSNKGLDKDVAEFLNMCNELSFKFWTLVNSDLNPSRSVTISPFGMISTLAMIFLGARGLTSNQMNDILKLDDVVTFNPHLVFQNITDTVTLARGQGIENAAFVRALFADRLKVRRIIPFYKEQAQQFYEGAVVDINFSTAGDILSRRTNLLIRKQTGGRIKDFMKTHTVPLRSPLTALSANVFQTSCVGPEASSEGRDGEMYFAVSQTVKQRKLVPIPAVVWKSGVSAGYEPSLDATAVALGDSKRPVSLIMVMPGQQGLTAPGDNLERLEQRLFANPSENVLEKLLKVIIPRRVEVQVPKFSHRSAINVTSALKKMGFDQLFTKTADLKGINGAGHDLYLADMVQMNLFCTCGDENKLGGRHLSETYPGTTPRYMRSWRSQNNINNADYYNLDNRESGIAENRYSTTNKNNDEIDPRDWTDLFELKESIKTFNEEVSEPEKENTNRFKNVRLWSRPYRYRRQAELEKPRMKMDKPFLYLIRHNLTGLILHIGRFNPKNQS